MGLPDPDRTFGTADLVGPRLKASPSTAFVAVANGELVGSVMASLWGSFGFFGPLTVRPDMWDRGVARRLLEPVVDLFDASDTVLSGLFTFAQSTKHVGLYQRYGYWPGYLTAIMGRTVDDRAAPVDARHLSEMDGADRATAIAGCARLTDRIYAGLDLTVEVTAVCEQRLGEVVLVDDDAGVAGFAVCHVGAGEADAGACFVKFAAARPGPGAPAHFARLLDAVDDLARSRGATHVVAGVDTARRHAYRDLLDRGYRTGGLGVRMHRPDDLGYGRVDAYVIDDLR
jgi:GNAT superfamily N-acetyltransferase